MERCKWYDEGICQLKSNAENEVRCSWDEPLFKACGDYETENDDPNDELLEILAQKVVDILIRDGYIEQK